MKALLVVLITNISGSAGIDKVEVPVKDRAYCESIANEVGASIGYQLGTYVRSVSTSCITTDPS